jgi:hypothetical protein
MESESSNPEPNAIAQMHRLVDALRGLRDSLMAVSLALTDFVTEMPSPARDEVVIEAERYLARLIGAQKRDFD